MGRKKQKQKTTPAQEPKATTSLGSLLGGIGFAASDPTETTAEPPSPPADDPLSMTGCGNLKLHIEKKGRRGKSVGILQGVPPAKSAAVAKALRKQLGCGVTDKDGVITIQGGQTDRVRAWLISHGAKRVKGV
ncbi:MAG: translation initiation factor 1 (eIF-1/SUI1) [Myxococcota bacterium]|jgi:translation initiation factor 1 (eIF-1/SUI1)